MTMLSRIEMTHTKQSSEAQPNICTGRRKRWSRNCEHAIVQRVCDCGNNYRYDRSDELRVELGPWRDMTKITSLQVLHELPGSGILISVTVAQSWRYSLHCTCLCNTARNDVRHNVTWLDPGKEELCDLTQPTDGV
jgi:hypothetical protein